MGQFCYALLVMWCWSSLLLQMRIQYSAAVAFAVDELEDFPLDTNETGDENGDQTTIDLSTTFDYHNSSNDLESASSGNNRIIAFNKIMKMAMKEPTIRRSLAQVLPIVRAMSPTQRLTLATLVLKRLTSASPQSSLTSAPHLEQFSNKSADLMLPISVDIANILQSLRKSAESGRSTVLGTYYYNPLSAGYRVSTIQRPILYNIRRRVQTNTADIRKNTDQVPPEMMPPPYIPSSNVSYAHFNDKQQEPSSKGDSYDDVDNDHETENEDKSEKDERENESVDQANDDYDVEMGTVNGMETAANDGCDPTNDDENSDICYAEMYSSYPSERIVNSIKMLERKRVFGALFQDFIHNNTAEQNTEIQRRLGSVSSIPSSAGKEGATDQLCSSKTKYARPKKAKSTNGNWRFIVNTEHYTQTVRIETCLNADKSCSFLNENVESQCVQVYNYHRLLTWDEKSGLSLDLFKIPTCCSCQIRNTNANSITQMMKNSKNPHIEPHDNVIVDQSNIVYTPPLVKQKTKNKFNLMPIPSTPYSMLKRESLSAATKTRRPPQPAILPLQHLDGGNGNSIRYSTSDNAIRRTNSKTNILKGVYVPGKGTLTEQTIQPESIGITSTSTSTSIFPRRVNYNYHPIIDFFRSTAATQAQIQDRADIAADEWLPMTEGPRSIKAR